MISGRRICKLGVKGVMRKTKSENELSSQMIGPYRTVVFDLDGTLADTAPELASSVNVMLAGMGRASLTIEQVRPMMGDGVHVLVERAIHATGTYSDEAVIKNLPTFLEHYQTHLAEQNCAWRGAEQMLKQLKACGISLAICTNKLEQLTQPFLANMGWTGYFSAVICGDTLNQRKPHPAPLLEAVRRAGGTPALFVGDTIVDIATAEAAGLPIAIVDMIGGSKAAQNPNVAAIITEFSTLVALVLGVAPVCQD